MLGRYPFEWKKVLFSSLLRMLVGYMFLACLFMTVLQEDDVLNIFFDVLALEFVEKLDDILYALLKRGFFGKHLRVVSYAEHSYDAPRDDASTNRFARCEFVVVPYDISSLFFFFFSFATMKTLQG